MAFSLTNLRIYVGVRFWKHYRLILKYANLYLCEFRRKPRKTPNDLFGKCDWELNRRQQF